ncbi:lactate utilization protein C [Marinithermofilum abyssi]|uniref:Lactate utilization protein C n=1 Tax=Marinithermofilum abyssi TaxID=1571185 RepID=A0A8J2VGH8_9BACL|nr:lactate utilization protein C [Marinithermofilum abyssi]GGE09468.1 lactate utilization protein C [Marinithermofilum abyssi]
MTKSAKNRFLNKLSARLGRPLPEPVTPPEWESHPWNHLTEGNGPEDWVKQFVDNLTAAGGEVVRVKNRFALKKQIHQDLQETGCQRLVVWKEEPLLSLIDSAELDEVTVWSPDQPPEELLARAEQADAGLVSAEWGLAFTGTVFLWNERGRGRIVSLLPTRCLVVLSEERIAPRMEPVLAWIREQEKVPACLNFISGPSRTSDIENDLSIGVHGPGSLRVYLLAENDSRNKR